MDESVNQYRIWSEKMAAEAPLELPALVTAIKSRRVQADTWLYLDHQRQWMRAAQVPELQMFFRSASTAKPAESASAAKASSSGLKAGTLRRIKLLADLPEEELETFLQFMEVVQVKQFGNVVVSGEHGDAMYLVLEGEVRARKIIDGRETTLATLGVGEFFGEVSVLDHGPRSADVVANLNSMLLKISAASVEKLVRENPKLAAPFLYALSRAVVGRMRGLTKKYEDSIHFSRVAASAG